MRIIQCCQIAFSVSILVIYLDVAVFDVHFVIYETRNMHYLLDPINDAN